MSVHYIEEFTILDKPFGIEDYKDGRPPSEHFFVDGVTKRYQLWSGGCGIGTASTLHEARGKIHQHAFNMIKSRLKTANDSAQKAVQALTLLGDDPAFLFRFEVKS